jgi:hypothetical protein
VCGSRSAFRARRTARVAPDGGPDVDCAPERAPVLRPEPPERLGCVGSLTLAMLARHPVSGLSAS